MDSHERFLVLGATGSVGRHVVDELLGRGHTVRALVRDPARALLPGAVDIVHGDVVTGTGVSAAMVDVTTIVYLVHSMAGGRFTPRDFASSDRVAAEHVGKAAAHAEVRRIVYLGGLGPTHGASAHLNSRQEVADILASHVVDTVHARAAMVIAADSASFRMLERLVRRLPAMVCPTWVQTETQPIGIADVSRALVAAAEHAAPGPDVQLGGADVLSYAEMFVRLAHAIGQPPPRMINVPVFSPTLSSYWLTIVTSTDLSLARPLVHGIGTEMVVTTPPPPGINDAPLGFDAAVAAALA